MEDYTAFGANPVGLGRVPPGWCTNNCGNWRIFFLCITFGAI